MAGRSVRYPVLAADELTLYYLLDEPGDEPVRWSIERLLRRGRC
jgi:hypothetical protein